MGFTILLILCSKLRGELFANITKLDGLAGVCEGIGMSFEGVVGFPIPMIAAENVRLVRLLYVSVGGSERSPVRLVAFAVSFSGRIHPFFDELEENWIRACWLVRHPVVCCKKKECEVSWFHWGDEEMMGLKGQNSKQLQVERVE